MTAPQKFRSAINGFNREDVVSYIEYINARHETELHQLQDELENARKEIAELKSKSIRVPAINLVATAQMGELTEKCDRLEKSNAALTEQLAKSVQETEQLREQLAQMTGERDEALANRTVVQSRTDEELEAYRRAERTERLAQARASRMYDLANGTLADTAVQLDTAAAALGQLAEAAMERVQELQNAVTDSKQVLADAAASLSAIPVQKIEE